MIYLLTPDLSLGLVIYIGIWALALTKTTKQSLNTLQMIKYKLYLMLFFTID